MIRTAIIGIGGIGKAVAGIMESKTEFSVVGLVDKGELAVEHEGLDLKKILGLLNAGGSLAGIQGVGRKSDNALSVLLEKTSELEALVLAIPSIPHDLVASQIQRIIALGFKGAVVDVLDQSGAIELVLSLEREIEKAGITYVTGAGATPGLLSAVAALAAHSFIEVETVKIHFGVGISNYLDSNEASLREILAGWKGMGAEWAKNLKREEIQEILDAQKGILEVSNLEHGDDVLLARSCVTSRDRVEVGGCIDTTRDVKPVSTTVKVTGRTFDHCRASHVFSLGDNTTMFANTAGPAVGYLARAVELKRRNTTGLFAATDLMPKFIC